jgi:hypothetical protein
MKEKNIRGIYTNWERIEKFRNILARNEEIGEIVRKQRYILRSEIVQLLI